MSWWLYVNVPAGRNHEMTIYERNFTYNNGGILRAAMDGFCFTEGQRLPASETAGVIAKGIKAIESDRSSFVPLEPANGWGGIDDTLEVLRGILTAFESEPESFLEVS